MSHRAVQINKTNEFTALLTAVQFDFIQKEFRQ